MGGGRGGPTFSLAVALFLKEEIISGVHDLGYIVLPSLWGLGVGKMSVSWPLRGGIQPEQSSRVRLRDHPTSIPQHVCLCVLKPFIPSGHWLSVQWCLLPLTLLLPPQPLRNCHLQIKCWMDDLACLGFFLKICALWAVEIPSGTQVQLCAHWEGPAVCCLLSPRVPPAPNKASPFLFLLPILFRASTLSKTILWWYPQPSELNPISLAISKTACFVHTDDFCLEHLKVDWWQRHGARHFYSKAISVSVLSAIFLKATWATWGILFTCATLKKKEYGVLETWTGSLSTS